MTRSQKRIYLDHAALTPLDPEVLKEMRRVSGAEFANPSSIHTEGVAAHREMQSARKRIADALRGHDDEIIFTASGTEANDLAIVGLYERVMRKLSAEGKKPSDLHFITSSIEHASVIETANWLKEKGVKVDLLKVDGEGVVDLKELKEKIRPNTFMVSIMHVNNEIGTIQPIQEIARIVRAAKKASRLNRDDDMGDFPYLHVDACQSPEYMPLDMRSFGADMLTLDGQKVYGPRGIGLLWVRRGIKLDPIIHGGGQERGLRSGTENLAAICGLALALERALDLERQKRESGRVTALRDRFIDGLYGIPKLIDAGIDLNGSRTQRIANNINISLPRRDTEFLLIQLDAHGISCSTKSSCLTDEDESYVIAALGKGKGNVVRSLRFSLGRSTTEKDIDRTLEILARLD